MNKSLIIVLLAVIFSSKTFAFIPDYQLARNIQQTIFYTFPDKLAGHNVHVEIQLQANRIYLVYNLKDKKRVSTNSIETIGEVTENFLVVQFTGLKGQTLYMMPGWAEIGSGFMKVELSSDGKSVLTYTSLSEFVSFDLNGKLLPDTK